MKAFRRIAAALSALLLTAALPLALCGCDNPFSELAAIMTGSVTEDSAVGTYYFESRAIPDGQGGETVELGVDRNYMSYTLCEDGSFTVAVYGTPSYSGSWALTDGGIALTVDGRTTVAAATRSSIMITSEDGVRSTYTKD